MKAERQEKADFEMKQKNDTLQTVVYSTGQKGGIFLFKLE